MRVSTPEEAEQLRRHVHVVARRLGLLNRSAPQSTPRKVDLERQGWEVLDNDDGCRRARVPVDGTETTG